MDALQKAVVAVEKLTVVLGMDQIYLEALMVQSGDPAARLQQQNEAMADALGAVAEHLEQQPEVAEETAPEEKAGPKKKAQG